MSPKDPSKDKSIRFPLKLFSMLEGVERDGLTWIVSWQPHGRAFSVHRQKEFVTNILPQFFEGIRYRSFQRQLNIYGFRRISKGEDAGSYYHELFLRGKPHLIQKMAREPIKGDACKTKSLEDDKERNFHAVESVNGRHKSICDTYNAKNLRTNKIDIESCSEDESFDSVDILQCNLHNDNYNDLNIPSIQMDCSKSTKYLQNVESEKKLQEEIDENIMKIFLDQISAEDQNNNQVEEETSNTLLFKTDHIDSQSFFMNNVSRTTVFPVSSQQTKACTQTHELQNNIIPRSEPPSIYMDDKEDDKAFNEVLCFLSEMNHEC